MQVVPVAAETGETEGDLRDPLGEDGRRPVRAIVHRYPDRALFLAADRCAVYCRHCTRRRITGGEEGALDRERRPRPSLVRPTPRSGTSWSRAATR